MTAPAGQQQTSEHDQWRGVAAEHSDEITERASIFLRRRSRALLADLLRPYGSFLWVLLLAVVIENAARLSLPWLVYRAIDFGVPPLLSSGDARVLYQTVGLMVVAVLIQWGSRCSSCGNPDGSARRCCWSFAAGSFVTSSASTSSSTTATPPAGWCPG